MSYQEAITLAARINTPGYKGVGHAWVNPGLADNDSSVSVRSTHGVETEIHSYPRQAGYLGMLMFVVAHTPVPVEARTL